MQHTVNVRDRTGTPDICRVLVWKKGIAIYETYNLGTDACIIIYYRLTILQLCVYTLAIDGGLVYEY